LEAAFGSWTENISKGQEEHVQVEVKVQTLGAVPLTGKPTSEALR